MEKCDNLQCWRISKEIPRFWSRYRWYTKFSDVLLVQRH